MQPPGGEQGKHYFAHSLPGRPVDEWQPLAEHLQNVAAEAERLAVRFGAGPWGRAAGQLHDLGKYSDAFQRRLGGDPTKVDHATAGSIEAGRRFGKLAPPLQYVVAGHHAGLADADGETKAGTRTLDERLKTAVEPYGAYAGEVTLPPSLSPPSVKARKDRFGFQMALFTRMLFGCLVDADYRDTEQFYNRAEGRDPADEEFPDLAILGARLDAHLARFESSADPVNVLRAEVLAACREKSDLPPGVFTLTVPTGGGKTLASLAFALRHAIRNGQERVIYVVPFMSIIEQNARVFRETLGEGVVLEHHSGFDDAVVREVQARKKLEHVSPRFAAPVVVTTAVQFFESQFSNRPGRCRKLPAFAKAVIVLDEAQTLPLELLRPCVAVLDELARSYGSTIVLCTATQPALNAADGFSGGFENVTEIAPDPPRLYRELERVRLVDDGELAIPPLADRLRGETQVLCIVDTRRQAREVFEALGPDEEHFHLSLWMCAKHRTQTLDKIRARLAGGLPCRVVSTTLIEAGVDVDFPTVFRTECGLDQLAQAAGRCNRNGKRPVAASLVHRFRFADSRPLVGERQRRVGAARMVARQHQDLLGLDAVRAFFGDLFWTSKDTLDAKEIMKLHELRARDCQFRFAEIAALFRMIDDEQVAVIVPYKVDADDQECQSLIDRLKKIDRPLRGIMRPLQRYVVSMRLREQARLLAVGAIAPVGRHEDIWQLVSPSLYRPDMGLVVDDPTFRSAEDNIF